MESEVNRHSKISKHKRSKTFSGKASVKEDGVVGASTVTPRLQLEQHLEDDMACASRNEELSPRLEVHNSLKQEIRQLEKRLKDQFEVRRALEKALGYQTSSDGSTAEILMPKQAAELIKEIAVLELEVVYLEQYLLSLYRKAFDQQMSSPSRGDQIKPPLTAPEVGRSDTNREDKLLASGIHQCHSSVSQYSALSPRTSPPGESSGRDVPVCHSQPLSTMELVQNDSNVISLAEHLGTRISDHIADTPNKLSEDMIRCMAAIYCKLSDPPLTHNILSSPISSSSSISALSPHEQCDLWSPGFRNNSSFDVRLDNPFLVEGLKEFSGPYSTMIEVPWIYRDGKKLGDVEDLLQSYRSYVSRLEEVDPGKLEHKEKLAFWINIHNSLVMHAFLAYGIQQNNVKRLFLLLKAAYNVGGHTISADTIQNTILGCRKSHPSQWLRLFVKTKFKRGDIRQAYELEQPEPLLHFALSSGNHSDPAVRVYTPKRVFQELETAKEEYIRATFGVRKNHKILLTKIVQSFAKDSGLCQADVIEMIRHSLPEFTRKYMKRLPLLKTSKVIEWIPHNFSFRYLISKELLR